MTDTAAGEPATAAEATEADPEEAEVEEAHRTISGKKSKDGERGDLLVQGIWEPGTDLVLDGRVCNTDAKKYLRASPERALERAEREKKRKYLQACLDNRRHFTPLVASVDGLLGVEFEASLKRLAAKVARKWESPYSQVCGYLRARVSISLIRSAHRCLRGSRVPSARISSRRPQWEDGAGLGLWRR